MLIWNGLLFQFDRPLQEGAMEGRARGRPGAPLQQWGGAGRPGAAEVLWPLGPVLPGYLQPGRGVQPQAQAGGHWIPR